MESRPQILNSGIILKTFTHVNKVMAVEFYFWQWRVHKALTVHIRLSCIYLYS